MNSDIIIQLYKSQFKIICYYLVKNGCIMEDAEDIVSESFIKAIKYIDGVDSNKMTSWLFTVSINTYKNYLKRKNIVSYVSIDNQDFYKNIVGNNDVCEDCISREKSKSIVNVLNDLKDEYRSILILKYDMELSYKEISLLLGISEDVVKTYLYRARNKFKEEWRKYNG